MVDWRSDEDSVTQNYSYEATCGRLARTTDMEGNYIENGYDTQGNLIEASYRTTGGTQTRLKRWSYQHPTYPGLLWKELQADDNFTQYAYDTVGNLTGLTDPENHQTIYTHDDLGRLVATVSPDTGTTTYAYDEAGNRRWKTDAKGVTVETVYDVLNRPTSANFPPCQGLAAYSIAYSHDQRTYGKGHLTGTTDPSGTTLFNYNARGRLIEKNVTLGSLSFPLSRQLSPGGRVQRLTHPNGRTVDFERVSCACRVSRVLTTLNGVTKVIADQLDYRPFGEVYGMDLGNGGVVNTQFDLDGRLLEANPATSKRGSFAYDALGRLTSVTAPNTPWFDRVFDYDATGRLTDAEGPPFGTIHYTYDRAGNRVSVTENSVTETYGYAAGSNRLSSVTGPGGTTVFSSHLNGNQVGAGTRSLFYNQDNRLIRVEDGASVLGAYTYNALGQRVAKSVGGTTTLYLYDFEGNLLAETSGAGTITTEYLYRGRNRLAMVDSSTGAVSFFHTDQFGTPQLMTNEANTQIWQANHKPFGEAEVNAASAAVNNFRFQGQYYDQETGYHYNYHRYYEPKTGRYLTPDPIGLAGGINPYVYVENDPVNLVDPAGLFNYAKAISALGNAGIAGWTAAAGAMKLGIAVGLIPASATVVGGIPPTALAAWATWNFKCSRAAWNRSTTQWNEALCEEWSAASWKNLYGLLPGGTHYDDPDEPSGPLNCIQSLGWFRFLEDAGYF